MIFTFHNPSSIKKNFLRTYQWLILIFVEYAGSVALAPGVDGVTASGIAELTYGVTTLRPQQPTKPKQENVSGTGAKVSCAESNVSRCETIVLETKYS